MSAPEPVDLICPSCGREFGEWKRCIYCAARRDGRKDVSHIRLFALPLLAMSLFYFFLAMSATPSYRTITSLGEADNFQRVRVRGEVLSVRAFTDKYKRGTSVVLGLGALDDQSPGADPKRQEIRLKADGRIGHELENQGRVPSVGDILDVSASLFAGRGYRQLSLNSARNLKVVGATENKVVYTATTVAEILADPESMRDTAVALPRVRIAKRLGRFHLGVTGEGGSPELRVYGLTPRFYRPDDVVSLRGRWTQFKEGQPWELKVESRDPNGCVVLERSGKPPFKDEKSEPAKVVTVAELLANPAGYQDRRVKVDRAEVVTVRERRSMEIRDEAGADALAVFGITPWKFEPGDIVSVSGTLSKYEKENRWELKVERKGRGARVLEKLNPDRERVTIAQLLAAPGDYEGTQVLVLEAVVTAITDASSFRAGDPAGSESGSASGVSTSSAPDSGTSTSSVSVTETSTNSAPASRASTDSVSVSGSSTKYLSEGTRVLVRGEFVRHVDGDGWEIRIAPRDFAGVRVLTSRRPTDGAGR